MNPYPTNACGIGTTRCTTDNTGTIIIEESQNSGAMSFESQGSADKDVGFYLVGHSPEDQRQGQIEKGM